MKDLNSRTRIDVIKRAVRCRTHYRWPGGLALLLGIVLLGSCSRKEDVWTGPGENMPVVFNASVQTALLGVSVNAAPGTRTASGPDGTTIWEAGDAIGIFMLAEGGTIPGGLVSGANNKKYNVSEAAAGTLAPADGTPLYYPQGNNVDFVAYYPYGASGAGTGNVTDNYKYKISVADQSDPAAIDVLYAKTANVARSKNAVNLTFNHILTKITLNVKAGEGITPAQISGLAANDVQITGMPDAAELDLQQGTLTPGITGNPAGIHPLKIAAVTGSGADASFTAILVPQPTGGSGRTVVFTVNGQTYTWTIDGGEAFLAGNHYVYPVTVQKTGIETGSPTIADWTVRDNGSGTAAEIGKGIEKVFIPSGTFLMGSSDGSNSNDAAGTGLNTTQAERNRDSDEVQHKVRLTKSFYMSRYEITNSQYAIFLNAEGIGSTGEGSVIYTNNGAVITEQQRFISSSSAPSDWGLHWSGSEWAPVSGYEDHPVINVTWYGAKAFADWVGGSLPTEAQWEYACRGGQTGSLPFGLGDGTKLYSDMANFNGKFPYSLPGGSISNYDGSGGHVNTYLGHTAAVGSYPYANGYGLYDMHGNVWEWCTDWYASNYGVSNLTQVVTNPVGPVQGSNRVVRGGSWFNNAQYCRSAFRISYSPGYAYDSFGFRVVFP